MRHGRIWLTLPLLLVMGLLSGTGQEPKGPTPKAAPKEAEEPEDLSAEEQKEKQIAERFQKVLEGNPRRGTALDRLYGYHVERGSLDKLVKEYRERAKKDPKDGISPMIVGLLEAQRGKDAAAVAAFTDAEKKLPDNAIPPYYLGQSLVLIGQPDAAAEAFERAITRKPNRNDLLDIFQALGRVYQRAQRTEKALNVWARLEALFPDDPRVQDQIATTLVEEGQFDQALPRIEKLAKTTQDPYRKSSLQMDAAELKVKLKRSPEALKDFEKLIADLNPDSWLYREVRRRIEDVFLRNDDLAGLAKYYEGWVEKNPNDLESISRLAKALANQGRLPEARKWLEKGIDSAPTNKVLRHALIDQLVYEQKYGEAAAQYEALDKTEPNNPDTLREWGKVLMRDTTRAEADRKAAAVSAWKKLLDKRPKDPVAVAQVADLVRTAQLTDEAIALYKKAIELAPDSPQYREYLGEYYHSLKRTEEAMATWRPIAEGANRNAKNLTRLAEVLSGFGYKKEAAVELGAAVELDKDDINLRITYADLLHTLEKYPEALAQLDVAAKLISNPEEAEAVLVNQIKMYQATEELEARIAELQKELDAGKDATAERWHRLARYYEAGRQSNEATTAIAKAVEKDPKSIPILTSAARIHEGGGNLQAAADTYRRLAKLDRRYLTEYLSNVAKLESKLGRREQALQAGRDLLAAAPGNPDHYKFFAELCFQLGDPDEGIESLRRSVRANPSEPTGLLTLANALSERQRPGEAIELLWRAFEKTNELEAKLSVIGSLTELYLQQNQFDKLLERLERERKEAEKAREMTLCIAQAYQAAGDFGTARQQLERLLSENTRDTALLGQLSALAEAESDFTGAVKFQRQLEKNSPNNRDAQMRLAQLLVRTGETQEAAEMWVKLAAGEPEPHRNLQAIDGLFTGDKHDTVLAITSRLLAQKPGDWELIYREGVALMSMGKEAEGMNRFKAILTMRLPDDTQGETLKARQKMATKTGPGGVKAIASARRNNFEMPDVPLLRRTERVYELRAATGIEPRIYYGSGRAPVWMPMDYGQARMACLGWQLGQATKAQQVDAMLKPHREAKEKPGADQRTRWDWYYLQLLRNDYKAVFETARELAKSNDANAQLALLTSLASRHVANQRGSRGNPERDTTPPLPPDQLDLVMTSYTALRKQKPDWMGMAVVQNVMKELKRAKKNDEETAVYRECLAATNTPQRAIEALGVASERGDADNVIALFQKLEKLQGAAKSGPQYLPTRNAVHHLAMTMGKKATEKAYDQVTKLVDLYLSHQRRLSQQKLSSPGSSRSSMRSGQTYIQMYGPGGYGRGMYVDFPTPNDYFDEGAISLLRNAFETFKKADLLSDLFAHYRKQSETGPADEKVYHQLAVAYLLWWNGEKEDALNQLTLATKQVPGDLHLLIDVAELHERNNDPATALAMLDAVTPLDHQTMQRRERAALRMAERTGNVERARQAADRLFGLRLDAETQVELAGKMHRLGMHAMAETILSRAQRQAGNRTGALVSLMNQYQTGNQQDLAVQIARQLLRKAPTMNFDPYRGRSQDDGARDQAIQTLARSGKLKEMIERTEAQLKTSPNAVQIHQSLLDFYKAAGDKDKYKATIKKIVELKPDDAKLRMSMAQMLQQSGDHAGAAEHYAAAIRREPRLFAYRYWEIFQAFQQSNKNEELQKVFDEIDFRGMGSYWMIMEVAMPLIDDEKTRPQGMKLFKKLWDAFPDQRQWILGNLDRGNVWQLPEIYDYARQGVIPRDETGMISPWAGAEEIMGYDGDDGRVTGVVTRLMDVARRQNRMDDLRAEVQAGVKKNPDWGTGKAMLAIFDLQGGDVPGARKRWAELLDDKKNPMPHMARFILGQELAYFGSMEDLYLKTLEGAVDDAIESNTGEWEFSYSPVRQLIHLYEKLGRKDDARALVQKTMKSRVTDYDPGYNAYRRVSNAQGVAQYFEKIGEPVEAVRILNELLADRDTLQAASRYYDEGMEVNVEMSLRRAVKALKPDNLPGAVRTLLTPRPPERKARDALDLVLLVEPRDLTKAALSSMLANALRSTSKSSELRTEMLQKIDALVKGYPKDFSVQIAAALATLTEDKAGAFATAVEGLVKLMEATPLEELPPGTKANARQRAEAMSQVPLWLVAKECLAKKELRSAGEKLATRSVQAARRQNDNLFASAILREWGQIELDTGNKQSAEARWSELLDIVLPPPSKKKPMEDPAANDGKSDDPAATPGGPQGRLDDRHPSRLLAMKVLAPLLLTMQVAPAPVLAVPTSSAPSQPGMIAVYDNNQFTQAVQIARLAADKGLPSISLKAMRDALRGGPPVNNPNNMMRGRVVYVMGPGGQPVPMEDGYNVASVDGSLRELVKTWRKQNVPVADIYEVLAGAVLPAARPAEVFLYTAGSVYYDEYGESQSTRLTDQSIGRLLTEVATETGKADDLKKRIQARIAQPLGEMPGRVLLAHLSLQAKEPAEAIFIMKQFAERLQTDKNQATSDMLAPVALLALDRPELAAAALPVVEKAAQNSAVGNQNNAQELFFRLARFHLEAKNPDAARQVYKEIEELGKKSAIRRGEDIRNTQADRLAREFLGAGWLNDALVQLARVVDEQPAPRPGQLRDFSWNGSMAPLVRRLLELDPPKRYEVLKGWTLPESTKVVRVMVGTLPQHVPPPAFGKFPTMGRDDMTSTLDLLIGAANQCGKFDELSAAVDQRVADKVDLAADVQFILKLARGQSAALTKEFGERVKEFRERANKPVPRRTQRYYYPGQEDSGPPPVRSVDYLVARACLVDTRARGTGEQMMDLLLTQAQKIHNQQFSYQARRDLAAAKANASGAGEALAKSGLSRWYNASARTIWLADDGHVIHAYGNQPGYLLFDTPLGGTFEFSVDGLQSGWAEGHAGYGGYVFAANRLNVASSVWCVGNRDRISATPVPIRDEAFNRITVKVEPGKVTAYYNGEFYYEDKEPGGTSPWLMLVSEQGRKPVWRNFVMTGKPEVLREVKLTNGNSIDGWMPHVYGGNLPARMTKKQMEGQPQQEGMAWDELGRPRRGDVPPPVYDWEAKDGEITGRKLDAVTRTVPSKLAYFRPMRPGEKIRYEFFHEPGKTHVHPSLGRLAFLLEADGVRLHYLTDQAAQDWTGLKPDNAIDEPANRRGPTPLPLKANDWNSVVLSLGDGTMTLELNGTVVYERKLEPEIESLFGFFHYRDKTAARVRNVVLTGNWPERIGLEDTALVASADKPAEAAVRRAIIGERAFAQSAGMILEKAQKLPPADQYKLYADWVLPSAGRPMFQLSAETTPLDRPPPTFQGPLPEGSRMLLGSKFEAPALELVRVAKELNKLDELAGRVKAIQPQDPGGLEERGKIALLAAIRAEELGGAEQANEFLQRLIGLLKKLPVDAPVWQRWPEIIAVRATMKNPALLNKSLALADALVVHLQGSLGGNKPFQDRDVWVRLVRNTRALAQALSQPEAERRPFGSDPGLAYWAAFSQVQSGTRGPGHPAAHWLVENGIVKHLCGHSDDYLGLRMPLRGDFTFECELTSFGWREAHVAYGGLRFDFNYDKKFYFLHRLDAAGPKKPIEPPFEKIGDWYAFKMEVKDNKVSYFVEDRKVATESLGFNPDPFLMLHGRHDCTAGFRNVKITGTPTIPDVVDLSSGPDLKGWRSYHGGYAITKRGEEMRLPGYNIFKTQYVEGGPTPKRVWTEQAVHYHRPLTEDGTVEYEFWHEPDVCTAHPMMDRLVLLLEPKGVRVHWLLDGLHDLSGLKRENVADEPSNRRGPEKLPLKDKAWNKVRVTLKGDTLTLNLNGEDVCERKLESTNLRTFGVFNWGDLTELRVRNVTLKGDWGKEMPPIADLFKLK